MSTRPSIEDAARLAAPVQGWLTDAEGRALYQAAAACRGTGVIVEIGSFKGRSTIWLAAGARASRVKTVYAIDPHQNSWAQPDAKTFDEFDGNVRRAGFADLVKPIVGTSSEAARTFNEPIEALFIDGDHDLDAVQRDVELWVPKVVEGGMVLFHDVATGVCTGPRDVVRRSICRSPMFARVHLVDSLAFARKVRRATPQQRLANRYVGCLLRAYDLRQLPLPRFAKTTAMAVLRHTPLRSTLP